MEAILARALEYTLKYWLKSFSRDQLKLQGRSVQLSNLDINGEALHASMGLPPALNVTKARVGKFEIILPYVSNVQVDPIVIQIDKLDLVLEENGNLDASSYSNSIQPSVSTKSGTYGFADKIADGMTVHVSTVNLLIETRGSGQKEGGAAWSPPLASITIRNLLLYTTNENWQVVNLKEARDFSLNKKFIYVFRKLEWESLSIDLLPHPDMFADISSAQFQEGGAQRDSDGAKRVFFGGERFLEGISGEANITLQRTEQNNPLGLEVQIHITEAVCPALSEPGLRALLRFLTGFYVCLNRGDVDIKPQKRSEAAGRSLVAILVDNIFLCIKDTEFRLELLMQSLLFSRASVSEGGCIKNLTTLNIGGVLLRDTFSRPPCVLVQPSTGPHGEDTLKIPEFAKNFCPPIYPCLRQEWLLSSGVPLMCLYSLQVNPSPEPPSFASETVIVCQPIMFHLQEESCLRISSFLVDGIMVVNNGEPLLENSVNSVKVALKAMEVVIPLNATTLSRSSGSVLSLRYTEARLLIADLSFSESPLLKVRQLNLEKDPACYLLWLGQPIDSSQKKWQLKASHLVISLDASSSSDHGQSTRNELMSGSWKCLEFNGAIIEIAMVSADGSPMAVIPPPRGIVRVGLACQQFVSNSSVEQLFFVLDLYAYFGEVWEKIASVRRSNSPHISDPVDANFLDRAPCDTVVSLALNSMQLRFLESSSSHADGLPLAQFLSDDLVVRISHRMLGGAVAISSTAHWRSVEVSCVATQSCFERENGTADHKVSISGNDCHLLRPVLSVHHQNLPFLEMNLVHVIPLNRKDRECHNLSASFCASGVRLVGGVNYAESLLHRFGIFGPDGGPGVGLAKGLRNLSQGPLSKLFKSSQFIAQDFGKGSAMVKDEAESINLGIPDEVDIRIEMKDWLFAMESAENIGGTPLTDYFGGGEIFWHAMFDNLSVKVSGSTKQKLYNGSALHESSHNPFETISVAVEGLQISKPREHDAASSSVNGAEKFVATTEGINLETSLALRDENGDDASAFWAMESLKFSVKKPIEAIVTKDELRHLTFLCKSEVDAAGRITAGILKLLKLEHSIGHSALNHLCNLGSDSFEKIFSPERVSGANTPRLLRSPEAAEGNGLTMEAVEEAIMESQVRYDSLKCKLPCLQDDDDATILADNLRRLKILVSQLRRAA